MKICVLIFLCLLKVQVHGQDSEGMRYFVTATNGLICRGGPSPDSVRIGKLPYGAIVSLSEKTPFAMTVEDREKQLSGYWWRIGGVGNSLLYGLTDPYTGRDYWTQTYVFSGFLEPLEKASVQLNTLSETEFDELKLNGKRGDMIFRKITAMDSIQAALQERVTWHTLSYRSDTLPDTLRFANGTQVKINPDLYEYWIRAYYPDEDLLLFTGGHESDFSISMQTGETVETVGNPAYIRESPCGKTRINGIDFGQGCIDYFFQEVEGKARYYLCDFKEYDGQEFSLCWFEEFYWMTDYSFIFSYLAPSFDTSPEEIDYYWGEIVRD